MDLLKSPKRRSRVSESAYIALNLGFVVAVYLLAVSTLSIWLAVALVLLSKWRVLAVRPRFWFANIVANMVDIVVGVSTVVLIYAADGALWLQATIAVLYAGWLLFIKPRSARKYMTIQAGVSIFVGITALSIISYSWDVVFFVACMWGIGFTAARHVLSSYEEPMTNLYALMTGLVFAELGWVGYHWLFAYTLPGFGDIKLSQLALFLTLLTFVSHKAYQSYHHNGTVVAKDIIMPTLLTLSIISILLIFFNGLGTIGSI